MNHINEELLFVDIETTGIEVTNHILELSMVKIDKDCNVIDTFSMIIHHNINESNYKNYTNDYVWQMHNENGLWEACKSSVCFYNDLFEEIDRFVERNYTQHGIKPMFAGNSVSFDKKFLLHYMPSLEEKVHYRILDVSSLIILAKSAGIYEEIAVTNSNVNSAHRSYNDIMNSISVFKKMSNILSEAQYKFQI